MSLSKSKFNLRILPIFIFVAVLTLSIKINDVYDTFKNPAAAKLTIASNAATAEDSSAKETAELTKVLERSGNTASAASTAAPEVPAAINSFTQSEIAILQDLAERREALDLKDKEIDKKAVQLKVAEEEIDKKLQQLKAYEKKLKDLIDEYNAKEDAKVSSLVKLYSTMKPKDAARIFNTLDMDVLILIFKGMKPSVSSAILSQMNAEKAKAITAELVGNNF